MSCLGCLPVYRWEMSVSPAVSSSAVNLSLANRRGAFRVIAELARFLRYAACWTNFFSADLSGGGVSCWSQDGRSRVSNCRK